MYVMRTPRRRSTSNHTVWLAKRPNRGTYRDLRLNWIEKRLYYLPGVRPQDPGQPSRRTAPGTLHAIALSAIHSTLGENGHGDLQDPLVRALGA
jgi:hypothetical protein